MQGEGCLSGSIIDELHSSNIQGDQTEVERGVTGRIIDELYSLDIQ